MTTYEATIRIDQFDTDGNRIPVVPETRAMIGYGQWTDATARIEKIDRMLSHLRERLMSLPV